MSSAVSFTQSEISLTTIPTDEYIALANKVKILHELLQIANTKLAAKNLPTIDIFELRARCSNLEDENEKIGEQLALLELRLQQKDEEIKELRVEIVDLKVEIVELKTEIVELKTTVSSLMRDKNVKNYTNIIQDMNRYYNLETCLTPSKLRPNLIKFRKNRNEDTHFLLDGERLDETNYKIHNIVAKLKTIDPTVKQRIERRGLTGLVDAIIAEIEPKIPDLASIVVSDEFRAEVDEWWE